MCEPTTMFIMSAASSLGQAASTNRSLTASGRSAVESNRRQQESLVRRRLQEQKSAEADISTMQARVEQAKAKSALAGIESGASGLSQTDVLQEYGRQGGTAEAGRRQQFGATAVELGFAARDVAYETKNQLEYLESQKVGVGEQMLGLAMAAGTAHMAGIEGGFIEKNTSFFDNPLGIMT